MNRDRNPNSAKLGPCWLVFALGRFFSRLWRLLCVSWMRLGAPASILEPQVGHMLAHFSLLAAFFDRVQEWLQKKPAGIAFLLFVSTMQRGGTCEAHGIEKKSMKNRC